MWMTLYHCIKYVLKICSILLSIFTKYNKKFQGYKIYHYPVLNRKALVNKGELRHLKITIIIITVSSKKKLVQ